MLFPWNTRIFQDRGDAGKQLAKQLLKFAAQEPIVIALPRGGVPIGHNIAQLLHSQLNVLIVRKIGLPKRPEFGIGAIAEKDTHFFDEKTLAELGLSVSDLQEVVNEKKKELRERTDLYRKIMKFPDIKNKVVILVDDGLATGVSAKTAIKAVKKLKPSKIIFASPICALDSEQEIKNLVDEVLCLATPSRFASVGEWYQHFDQVTDEEVLNILKIRKTTAGNKSKS